MFILIWGTKQTARTVGFVAEMCPRCRTVRPMKVRRLGMVSHLFYVPLGFGNLIEFAGECQQCSGTFDIQPIQYPALEHKNTLSLDELIAKTNPKLQAGNTEALSASQRFALISDPFVRFSHSLNDRYARGSRTDRPTGLTLLATFVVPIVLISFVSWIGLAMEIRSVVISLSLLLFLLGIIATVVVQAGEPKRFFKRQIQPELARALKPLNPSQTELDNCFVLLKKYGYRIRKYITTESLIQDIRNM